MLSPARPASARDVPGAGARRPEPEQDRPFGARPRDRRAVAPPSVLRRNRNTSWFNVSTRESPAQKAEPRGRAARDARHRDLSTLRCRYTKLSAVSPSHDEHEARQVRDLADLHLEGHDDPRTSSRRLERGSPSRRCPSWQEPADTTINGITNKAICVDEPRATAMAGPFLYAMPMAVACSAALPTIGKSTNPTKALGMFQANAAPSMASQITFESNDISKVNKANHATATFGASTNSSSSSSSSSG